LTQILSVCNEIFAFLKLFQYFSISLNSYLIDVY